MSLGQTRRRPLLPGGRGGVRAGRSQKSGELGRERGRDWALAMGPEEEGLKWREPRTALFCVTSLPPPEFTGEGGHGPWSPLTDRWAVSTPVPTHSRCPGSQLFIYIWLFFKKQNFEVSCQDLTNSVSLLSIGSTPLIKPPCIPDESFFAWITLYSL